MKKWFLGEENGLSSFLNERAGFRHFWPQKLGLAQKNACGQFWLIKMVLAKFGGKNWFRSILAKNLVLNDFGRKNCFLAEKTGFGSVVAEKTSFSLKNLF